MDELVKLITSVELELIVSPRSHYHNHLFIKNGETMHYAVVKAQELRDRIKGLPAVLRAKE